MSSFGHKALACTEKEHTSVSMRTTIRYILNAFDHERPSPETLSQRYAEEAGILNAHAAQRAKARIAKLKENA